jgi:hypothetical protein
MGVSISYDEFFAGAVTTTNGTATDVPGLTWVVPDKSTDIFEIEAIAVRNNAAGPNVLHHRIVGTARQSGAGAAEFPAIGAGDANPKSIVKHAVNADSAMQVAIVVAGLSVKVQVTGLGSTTIDWRLRVRRTTLTSS